MNETILFIDKLYVCHYYIFFYPKLTLHFPNNFSITLLLELIHNKVYALYLSLKIIDQKIQQLTRDTLLHCSIPLFAKDVYAGKN